MIEQRDLMAELKEARRAHSRAVDSGTQEEMFQTGAEVARIEKEAGIVTQADPKKALEYQAQAKASITSRDVIVPQERT